MINLSVEVYLFIPSNRNVEEEHALEDSNDLRVQDTAKKCNFCKKFMA